MLQNAATYAPLTGEQIAALVEEVPQIEYIKEERPPGPRHIAEVQRLAGDRVKTIFGGFGGRVSAGRADAAAPTAACRPASSPTCWRR